MVRCRAGFFIVVAGILLAFQITNWNEAQQEKATFVRADVLLTEDILDNYSNAKRHVAVTQCRMKVLGDVGARLMEDGEEWIGVTKGGTDRDRLAFEKVLNLPKNLWKYRVWNAELAHGSFDLMDPLRRNSIDAIFAHVELMELFGIKSIENESRLAILSQTTTFTRQERNRLFELVAEFDEYGFALGAIGGLIVNATQALDLKLTSAQKEDLRDNLERFNASSLEYYADCFKPITTLFLDGIDSGEQL